MFDDYLDRFPILWDIHDIGFYMKMNKNKILWSENT